MPSYAGRCHCEKVTFSVSVAQAITRGYCCNCSLCHRLGVIRSHKLDPHQLMIGSGTDALQVYVFGDEVVEHNFCGYCGVTVFYTGSQCKVNLACLDELDIDMLSIEHFDGKHLL